jgi:hypothetical protein
MDCGRSSRLSKHHTTLLVGLPLSDLEVLTVRAIRVHRRLIEHAEQMFLGLPEDIKSGRLHGGALHLAYIEVAMEMHAQASIVSTLLEVLGRIPDVPAE